MNRAQRREAARFHNSRCDHLMMLGSGGQCVHCGMVVKMHPDAFKRLPDGRINGFDGQPLPRSNG